eukprot:362906-Chlamydomonas_euryale.AAC.6
MLPCALFMTYAATILQQGRRNSVRTGACSIAVVIHLWPAGRPDQGLPGRLKRHSALPTLLAPAQGRNACSNNMTHAEKEPAEGFTCTLQIYLGSVASQDPALASLTVYWLGASTQDAIQDYHARDHHAPTVPSPPELAATRCRHYMRHIYTQAHEGGAAYACRVRMSRLRPLYCVETASLSLEYAADALQQVSVHLVSLRAVGGLGQLLQHAPFAVSAPAHSRGWRAVTGAAAAVLLIVAV